MAVRKDLGDYPRIYAKFNLSGSILAYPGVPALTRLAVSGCDAPVGSLDKSKITNSMTIRFLFPDADAWLDGNSTVACMIANPPQRSPSRC